TRRPATTEQVAPPRGAPHPDGAAAHPAPCPALVARVVLERDPEPHAVVLDLPVLDRAVLPQDLGDAQVANPLRRRLHGVARGRLPRLLADPDHLGDPVDTLSHWLLPS